MHRIDTATAVTPIPAPDVAGTPGFFDKGNPAVPREATALSQDWCNSVQEEIAGVIEGAGDTLDKADNAQLLAAIQTIVGAVANPTGITDTYIGATAPAGWVLASGRTIGSAASGAAERANADTEALFTLLWNDHADTEATVSGGRGASAAADFAADKTITLPDARGRTIVGKDDMGGTAASRMTTAGSGVDGSTLGKSGGAETHTLAKNELAQHEHDNTQNTTFGSNSGAFTGWGREPGDGANLNLPTQGIDNASPGQAHNNTQPTIVENIIIKL